MSRADDEKRIDPTREPIPGVDVDPVEQLAHVVPALWRTLKRVATSAEDLPTNESQITILRLVIHHDGLSPAELADIMHLARPTVSNLLKSLVAGGLVERETGSKDARLITIMPTDKGRRLLQTFRSDRIDHLRSALDRMPESDRSAVIGAVSALRGLLRELEDEARAMDDAERSA